MDHDALHDLRRVATAFRDAIERSRDEKAEAQLPYFPEGACRMASCLFAMHWRSRSANVRLMSGHVPGCESYVRHHWLVVDDVIVDLTADPFGQPRVVIELETPFHDSLDERRESDATAAIAEFKPDEARRYRRWLDSIEARIPHTYVADGPA